MASKRFKVCGIQVEMWEKSFRVEGQAKVFFLQHEATQEEVSDLVRHIYVSVLEKVVEDGKRILTKAVAVQARSTLDALTSDMYLRRTQA